MKKILIILLCLCVSVSLCPVSFAANTAGSAGYSDTIIDETNVDVNGGMWIEDEPPPLADIVEDEPDLYDNRSFDAENAEQLKGERVDGQLLIKFKDPEQVPGKEKFLKHEIDKFKKIGFVEGLGVYVVSYDELEKNPNAVLNRLKNNKYIEYVEPNHSMNLQGIEALGSDTTYTKFLFGITQAINAKAGWELFAPTGGSSLATIAVVDSGIAKHPYLPTLKSGFSAVAGLSPSNDVMSHGTSVTGVLGAVGGKGYGVAGINWDASIVPVKVDDNNGSMTTANVAKGIMWAADNGARVINLSLGTTSDSLTMKKAIDYAYGKGCTLFAATGNSGKAVLEYPAAYENVMAVGSTNDGVKRTTSSTYGSGMDVVAVGSYYTTIAAGHTANAGGTSIACPQVSGLASLIWGLNPDLTNEQVYDLIREGAKPLGGGYNVQTGYGLIDIGRTLELTQATIPVQEEVPDPIPEPEPKPDPVITLTGFEEVTFVAGSSYIEDGYLAIDGDGKDITDRVEVTDNIDKWTEGVYCVTYSVTDDYDGSATAYRTVIVEPAPPAPEVVPGEEGLEAPQPPTITANGSSVIILHLGGTPYTEQGARALDYDGEDISGQVEVIGVPDETKAGTYTVTYQVTGKSGETATTERTVRILAPTESITRQPYNFSSQGKAGTVITHTNVVADQFGWMDLKVNSLDKNMTIKIEFISAATKKAVFTDTFSAAGKKQYQIDAGKYDLKVTISKANGAGKYDIGLLMPEVIKVYFFEEEVPLEELPDLNVNTYTVVSGDSLWRIAEKKYGDGFRWQEIYDLNKDVIGNDPNNLRIGQVLTIK